MATRSGEGGSASSTTLAPRIESEGWFDEVHFAEIDSTQSYVEREHESFNQARLTVVSADHQTAGRGTRDRTWEARKGKTITVTFYFRFPPDQPTDFVNRNAPNVTKVLSLAVVDALRWASGSNPHPRADLRINMKWPNDVVANGQKIAGVLARAVVHKGRLDGIIIGTGVNINQTSEEMALINRPVWPATSLRAVTGSTEDFDVASVRRRLVLSFGAELQTFFAGGFPAFRSRVNDLEVLIGTEVRFRVSDTEVIDGIFDGVDEDGLIVLRLPDGSTRPLPSGEIIPKK